MHCDPQEESTRSTPPSLAPGHAVDQLVVSAPTCVDGLPCPFPKPCLVSCTQGTLPGLSVAGELVDVQRACDRCTQGVMDADNPHLRGECGCACHGHST